MPARSGRRRRHKQLARALEIPASGRPIRAAARLIAWSREARRRAGNLSDAPAWGLANDPSIRAMAAALDPAGELQSDLDRACAEAVAGAAGGSLVRGSRPLADRARLTHADTQKPREATAD